jgi:hypothetical protein
VNTPIFRFPRRAPALGAACLGLLAATPLPVAAGDSTVGAGWVSDTASYSPGLPTALGSAGNCTGESWSTRGLVSGGGVINSAGQGYPPAPMSVAISGNGCETLVGGSGLGTVTLDGGVLSSTVHCGFSVVYTRLGDVLELDSAPGSCVVDGYTTAPTFFSLRGSITPADGGGALGPVRSVALTGAWTVQPTSGPI